MELPSYNIKNNMAIFLERSFMMITILETSFKHHSHLTQDFTIFPITEIEQHQIRTENKENFGEVFTPAALCDKMILISKPLPDQFNIDLCCGMGNFTIRMLRYFTNTFPDFNLKSYLENYHWFNELNPENVTVLLDIFKNVQINLLVGPAEKIKHMKCDSNGIFLKGIWHWNGKKWITDVEEPEDFDKFFEY